MCDNHAVCIYCMCDSHAVYTVSVTVTLYTVYMYVRILWLSVRQIRTSPADSDGASWYRLTKTIYFHLVNFRQCVNLSH